MSGATVAPTLPIMAQHFIPNAQAKDHGLLTLAVQLVLTGPALTIMLCAWGIGALVDRWGRLRLLWGALLLYALAGTAGLWLDSLEALVASRFVLGIAVAVVMTAATALIGDLFHDQGRESFMGVQAAFMGYGGVIFLSLGGALAAVHWRAPFSVYAVSLPVLLLVWLTVRPLIGPSAAPTAPQPTPTAPADASPQGPWLRWMPAILHVFAALVFIGFYQVPSQLPFFLMELDPAFPPWAVGLAVASLNVVAASMSLAYSRLRRMGSYRMLMASGFALLAGGLGLMGSAAILAQALGGAAIVWAWAATAVAGAGLGIVMPNMTVWLLAIVPPQVRGRAAGAQTAGVFLGQFLAPLVVHPLVVWHGTAEAFLGAASLLVGAALFCLKAPLPISREG